MALTVTDPIGFALPLGDRWLTIRQVDFDNDYAATPGEALTHEQLGFTQAPDVVIAMDKLGFSFDYDIANEDFIVKCPGLVTGAAGGGTLDDFPQSGLGATATSIGLVAGNATHRFGGMVEVAASANLSTLTDVNVLSIGKYPV